MGLMSDYFLLYHGVHYKEADSLSINNINSELMYELSALILMCDRKTYSKFQALDEFNKLINNLYDASFLKTLDDLYSLQATLIKHLQENTNVRYIHNLHNSFSFLKEEKILKSEKYDKLISLFDPHEFHSLQEKKEIKKDIAISNFKDEKSKMKAFIKELKELGSNLSYGNELDTVLMYLEKQKFSIGITGVMNAGKSTLLNALMGEEILGSSVVPETANLSLLKYAAIPYAKVFYWTRKEWEKIIYSAKEFESIALFIKQSEEHFKEDINTFITYEGRIDSIKVDELSLFTSAKHKKSNLIKEIELGVNLEFLSQGIEIVDTPGLDDVVIQREEITKQYLSKCDLMIHLMNVSQSATQKDISFIIDALLYQNVGRLLVVLTRADSVKEKELLEVIKYTKTSIEKQLKNNNMDSNLSHILSSLDFIAVSSKMALLHKMGKGEEALSQGYSLEDSGILKLEKYLDDTLYGENSSRGELIMSAAKIQLKKVLQAQISALHYELRLLSKNEDELAKELEILNLRKKDNKIKIKRMKDEIKEYKQDMFDFSKGLDGFLETEIFRVQERLKSRLMDDFEYALQVKDKKKFINGIDASLETSIKDAMVDTIRDYKYKYMQKSELISKKIETRYEKYELSLNNVSSEGSTLELINKHFKGGLVFSSSSVLAAKIKKHFEASSLKELSSLRIALENELKEAFGLLLDELKHKAENISETLVQDFFNSLEEPLENFIKSLEKEELLLSSSLINFEKDETKKAQYSIDIHKQIKKLESFLKRLAL